MWFILTLFFALLWYRSERCRSTWRQGAIRWKENYETAASDRDRWKEFQENAAERCEYIEILNEVISEQRDDLREQVEYLRSMLRDDESAGEDWKPPGWKPGEGE